MNKEFTLELLKMLSALESWSFSVKAPFPDYLAEVLSSSIEKLTEEVLK